MNEVSPRISESVRVVIFCPPNFKDKIINSLTMVGGENIQTVDGRTLFTPTGNAQPTVGMIEEIIEELESKVMAEVDLRVVNDLRSGVEGVHPYESFAFEVYSLQDNVGEFYSGKIKLKLRTNKPEEAMRVLSAMGAGVIGEYKDCFFIYSDEGDPNYMWVETICDEELMNRGLVDGFEVKLEKFLQDPVSFKRKGDAL